MVRVAKNPLEEEPLVEKQNQKPSQKIGTWNVRSLYQTGKVDNVINKMQTEIARKGEMTTWGGHIILLWQRLTKTPDSVDLMLRCNLHLLSIWFHTQTEFSYYYSQLKANPININHTKFYVPTADKVLGDNFAK